MKIVVSNSQVAHLWANQSQEHARSASMSFRGATLYSYSTAIATLFPVRGVALINSRKYSATTSSKHLPAVRNALRGMSAYVCIEVPEVSQSFGDMSRAHSINQSYLSAEYKTHAAKLMRVQSLGQWSLDHLRQLAEDASTYARVFGLMAPTHRVSDDWAMAQARMHRLANDPKRAARIAANERAKAAKAQRDAIARELRQTETLAAFRAGQGSYGWYLTDRDGAAYLRIQSGDSTNPADIVVQTSRGATVPGSDAIRAIRFIRVVMARGADWYRNGETCPVGQFQVDVIRANGDIKAGCHFIKWAEIEAIGTLLGC